MIETEKSSRRRPAPSRGGRGGAHTPARLLILLVLLVLLTACGDAPGEEGAENAVVFRADVAADLRFAGDWPAYHGDPTGTRYSPLTQIHTGNVANLTRAWSYELGARAGSTADGWQVTPLVVDGMMYLATPDRIVALDPETGNEIWRHRPAAGEAPSRRGVAYWPGDGNDEARVYFAAGRRLVALNARTGRRVASFGSRGEVDIDGHDALVAVPVVFRDLVVVAAGQGVAEAEAKANASADTGANVPASRSAGVTAFDARSGTQHWVFRPLLGPNDAVPEENGDESVATEPAQPPAPPGGFTMTLDVDRGLLFVTFGGVPHGGRAAEDDDEGAAAQIDSPFANALVALDVYTGALQWRFQFLRSDRWGYAPAAPPALLDVSVDGRELALLALATPSGYLYVLDRATGEPFHEAEERAALAATETEDALRMPADRSDEAGEVSGRASPRVPVRPPPLSRVAFEPEALITAAETLEDHATYCTARVDRDRAPVESTSGESGERAGTDDAAAAPQPEARSSAPLFPGTRGGAGWGGLAAHPGLGRVFVNTMDLGDIFSIQATRSTGGDDSDPSADAEAAADRSPEPFAWREEAPEPSSNERDRGPRAWPCQKPPWGRLLAVDVVTAEIVWEVPLGITESLPPEHRRTGRPNAGGAMVTAGGLVLVGAADDGRFRAFDSATGTELWATRLGLSAHAVPISYRGRDGKQYVAVAAAGDMHRTAAAGLPSLVVFALP